MTKAARKLLWAMLASSLLLSIQACHSLPNKEQAMLDELLSNPRSVCVGRYIFDLPEAFSQGGSTVFINNNRIEMQPMPLPAFKQRIQLREQELAIGNVVNEIDKPYLKGVHKLPNDMEGIIFERNFSEISPGLFRKLEAHYYHNGVAFKTEIEAENTDKELNQNRKESYPTNINAKLSELHNLLGRLHGAQAGDPMPEGPALCFAHGYLLGTSRDVVGSMHGEERVSSSFRIEGYPLIEGYSRMTFRIKTNNYMQEDDSLLERMSGVSMTKLLLRFGARVKTLSKGARTIQGAYAEELLVYNGSDREEKEYNYLMYINEQSGSNQTPFLEVEMDYGPIGNGTEPDEFTEKQLRAIWYQLTDSIRIRPGAI